MICRARARSALPTSCALLAGAWLTACPGTGPADAGPECPGEGAPAVTIGRTGLELVPLQDGDSLPAWQRPQGGIGTRFNVAIAGYGLDDDLALLGIDIRAIPPAGDRSPGTLGGPCREEAVDAGTPGDGGVDGGPAEELPLCDFPTRCTADERCEMEIAGFGYTNFPLMCLDDGRIMAPEVPVRFRTYLGLEDVEDVQARLTVEIEDAAGEVTRQQVDVVLSESEFIDPETFDPLS